MGNPLGRPPRPILERAAEKYEIAPDGCWNWTACIDRGGYGIIWGKGKKAIAHRVMYEQIVGPIPEGLTLDHLCRNRRCVNPAHLEPVPFVENVRRGDVGKWNAIKAHCPHGHPYDEANTYRNGGRRHCRECGRQRSAEWRATRGATA